MEMTEKEFRQRVMSLHRLMYGIAMRMGMHPDDAADVVQDTQIKLWRRRHSIPGKPEETRMYCLGAFRNACISWFRKQRLEDTPDSLPDVPEDSELSAEYLDTRSTLEQLIDTLPKGQRDTIRLSSFGGLENDEIAQATGLSEANVRQLLSRGRRKLRQLWAENT